MKLRYCLSLAAAVLLSLSIAATAQEKTGKIHGRVTDPTGVPKTVGAIILSTDGGKTAKYTFQISATGDFTGEGITPGTYSMLLTLPDIAAGKFGDQIDNVKIVAGEDLRQDDDMSRQEYIDKLSPDQKKQIEEVKKKNAEAIQHNSVAKALNADLNSARDANHAKKYDEAETLMLKDTAMTPAPPQSELLWNELGNAQIGLKKNDDAVTSFKKSLELSAAAKKPSPETIAAAHAGMGEAYARSNKPQDAASEYDLAAKANPPKAATYLTNEAAIFSNIGNSEAQGAAADKAIAADPNNPLPYYLKGQALIAKATVDAAGTYVLPPGCEEAYNKYLALAPTGQFANDVKAILAQSQTKVQKEVKNKK
jgi:tetratricopeptide (TPR) repeat protein